MSDENETKVVIVEVERVYEVRAVEAFAVVVPAGLDDDEARKAAEKASISDNVDWHDRLRDHLPMGHEYEHQTVSIGAGNPLAHDWLALEGGKLIATKPPDQPAEPPESAWIDVDGAQWATDGSIIVRRDGPRPTGVDGHHGWRPAAGLMAVSPSQIREFLEGAMSYTKPHPGRFQRRYAPVLKAGDVRSAGGSLAPAAVWRGSELVAVVMPCRPGTYKREVNASGEEVSYG